MTKCDIAVVGAGFSGTMTVVHLLRNAPSPTGILLIERLPERFARGVAYSSHHPHQLLNVPASGMSAFPDRADHFLEWAKPRADRLVDPPWVTAVGATSFLPRSAYGDYLGEVLADAEASAAPGVRLERRLDEIIGVEPDAGGVTLRGARSGAIGARKVVLALGTFGPRDPSVADTEFCASPRYVSAPWDPQALARVLPSDSCLLIGSGLTMVDWVVTLNRDGYPGTIHVLSRRGLWPATHRLRDAAPFDPRRLDASPTLRQLLRLLRDRIAAGEAGDWRAVIDGLRPHTQVLWRALSAPDRRRFLRHLRQFWDVHRHRIAPVVSEALAELRRSGRLVRHVGRITSLRDTGAGMEVTIRRRGEDVVDRILVGAVVNCSGSESDYRRLDSPLVRSLLEQGLARPDPLTLGLDVDEEGALRDSRGMSSTVLYTLGPPKKGVLWETTAVPEIRAQAVRLAETLIR